MPIYTVSDRLSKTFALPKGGALVADNVKGFGADAKSVNFYYIARSERQGRRERTNAQPHPENGKRNELFGKRICAQLENAKV